MYMFFPQRRSLVSLLFNIKYIKVQIYIISRLKHRGPDWSGLCQYGDNFLSHQRLAIIDPASGDQPLYNEDKSIIVTVQFVLLH
jgi:hypothetical protein